MRVVRSFISFLLLGLFGFDASSQTVVGGRASEQWTATGSPYLLAGFVVVQDGSLLEIEPGTEIQLMGKGLYVGFETAGELQANGVRIVGPGEIRFYSQENNMGLGLGWIKNSEFVDNATVSFHTGGSPTFEGNSGVSSISITDASSTLSHTWTLPSIGLPFLIDDSLTVSPTGQLILEGVTLVGNGQIIFQSAVEAPDESNGPSRIVNSDFSNGPEIIVFPGANLQIQGNIGIDHLTLPGQTIGGPGQFKLEDYGVPYFIRGEMSIAPDVSFRAEGISFARGRIIFRGPDENVSAPDVQTSYLTGCNFNAAFTLSIELGSQLRLEDSSGLSSIRLVAGRLSSPYDWTLPDYDLPYRALGQLSVSPHIGLYVDDLNFSQQVTITFRGPDRNTAFDSVRTSSIVNSALSDYVKIAIHPGAQLHLAGNSGIDEIMLSTGSPSEPFDWTLPDYGVPYRVTERVDIAPTQGVTISGVEFIGLGRIVFQGPNAGVPVDSVRMSSISNTIVGPQVDIGIEIGSRLTIENNQGIDQLYLSNGSADAFFNWTLTDYGVPYVIAEDIGISNGSYLLIPEGMILRFKFGGRSFGTFGVGKTKTATLEIRGALLSGPGNIAFGSNAHGSIEGSVFDQTSLLFFTQDVIVTKNRFENQEIAITNWSSGAPVIRENDFINTVVALQHFNIVEIDARDNYWGHASGPKHPNNPGGQGGEIEGPVLFSPWATTPFTTSTTVESIELPDLPFALESGYPNPFTSTTHLPFSISESGHVRIAVYDLLGRRIADIIDGILPVGRHEAMLSARGLAPGTYLVVLSLEGDNRSQFVSVVR